MTKRGDTWDKIVNILEKQQKLIDRLEQKIMDLELKISLKEAQHECKCKEKEYDEKQFRWKTDLTNELKPSTDEEFEKEGISHGASY